MKLINQHGIGWALALLILMSVTMVGKASAETTVEQLRASGATLGLAEEPPYASYSSDGRLSGAAADLSVAVLKKLGITKITPKVVDFGALVPSLQARRFDIVSTGLYVTPQRCKAVLFTEPDLCTAESFAVKKGNPLNLHSYKDLLKSGARVGVCGGCAEEKRALDLGVPRSQLVVVSDAFNGMQQLKDGRLDAVAWPDATLTATLRTMRTGDIEVAGQLQGEKMECSAAVFNIQDKQLRDAYDKTLAGMKQSGEFDKIVAPYGFNPALSKATKRDDLCGRAD